MRLKLLISTLIGTLCLIAQIMQQVVGNTPLPVTGITLETSCSNSGTTNYLACSSAMTVTAGDTITCKITGNSGGSNMTGAVADGTNGWYAAVYGVGTSSSLSWETTAVMVNSAGGSITPTLQYMGGTPSSRSTINCKAWKNVATSLALDPGAIEQTTSATVTNPTSGTAAAPTYNNEMVWAVMSRNSSTAPSSGGGSWLPSGTLTLVGGSTMRQADEYQIQTTAASVNGPFTGNGSSIATVDSQLALLPIGQTGGTTSVTGFYLPLGAAGSAPTGTVTTTTLGGSTSFLASVNANIASPFWTRDGAATISYDTGVAPTATGHIMVQGVDHTWGDAGSSLHWLGSVAVNNDFNFQSKWTDTGAGGWYYTFYKIASSGLTNNTFCDMIGVNGGVTTLALDLQAKYLTASGLNFLLEQQDSTANSTLVAYGSLLDTDLRLAFKLAGVNDRYHQLIVQTKSGSVWSQTGSTLQLDLLCANGVINGTCTPSAAASPTGTASSGSTALTVSSGTSIAVGQVVLGTGIPDPSQTGHPAWTVVEAVSGTSVTLSQNTNAAISGTTVNFYTGLVNMAAATNCTVTAGSTAMSCVAPLTGTITAGQSVGGKGVLAGTVVSAASGAGPISVTLSILAPATMNSGDGATFWNATSGPNQVLTVGKQSSCTIASDQWISGLAADNAGTGVFVNPN